MPGKPQRASLRSWSREPPVRARRKTHFWRLVPGAVGRHIALVGWRRASLHSNDERKWLTFAINFLTAAPPPSLELPATEALRPWFQPRILACKSLFLSNTSLSTVKSAVKFSQMDV